MYEKIKSIFEQDILKLIDDNRVDIIKTEIYREICSIDPKIKRIFDCALCHDESEFKRTIRHIFRIIVIYFQILNGKFNPPGNLKIEIFQKICNLISKVNNINKELIPCILLFHDIGKPFDRKFHPEKSASIVKKYKLLDNYNLSFQEKLIVIKVIEYHLMMGTIYNGESSLWYLKNFVNDAETSLINNNIQLLNLYLDLLVIFATLDIYGYFYGVVNENNIIQYLELRDIFYRLLMLKDDPYKFDSLMDELTFNRIDWRLSSAIRIFQYYKINAKYSKDFFIHKIWRAFEQYSGIKVSEKNWNDIKKKYFKNTVRVQLTYGLPILMRLALGGFKRRNWKIDENTTVKSDLIQFWVALNERIELFLKEKNPQDLPINVIWNGIPHWSKFNDKIIRLFQGKILSQIIKDSNIIIAKNGKNYNLILNFNSYLNS
ncbi:MAG: HD domain-containing protein [Candidatus Helarchaeota archaeon]